MKKRILISVSFLVILALFVCLNAFSGAYGVYVNGKSAARKLPVYCVDREDKKIAISFDCAWGTEYTDIILDALDFYGVKCTFFAVEFWVEKNPDYIRKIAERGHEIGTHSATHSHMSKLSESAIIEELSTSSKAISELTGKPVTLFRAPFGEYNDRVISTASGLGLYTVQWDVDSLDWKDLSAEQIYSRVAKKVKSGSIILCHNNGLHTAESLPLIFADLIERGYTFVPIGELIYKEDYKILPDGKQVKTTEGAA
ncbi:MAG: polysaccharide deacetylase family protein [Clostridia bacterium]|nr:polysaccharide deacetylase family protein [Clostridia bacterium]